jgi:hypothetical protein
MWKVALICHGIIHCIGLKMRGEGDEIEIFVDEYFSIAKFSATFFKDTPWEVYRFHRRRGQDGRYNAKVASRYKRNTTRLTTQPTPTNNKDSPCTDFS